MKLLYFLILMKLCFSIDWKCLQSCDSPVLDIDNGIYCKTLGSKSGNEISAVNYYDLMPSQGQFKYFTSVFKYVDGSNYYHSYGMYITGVSESSDIYGGSGSAIYRNTKIKLYVKISYISSSSVSVDTTFSILETGQIIGQTINRVYNSDRFGFIKNAQIVAEIGDSYSNTAKIYVYDRYTKLNGFPVLYTKNVIPLNSPILNSLIVHNAKIIDDYIFISFEYIPYNISIYLNYSGNSQYLKYDTQCNKFDNVYWGFIGAPSEATNTAVNENCIKTYQILLNIPTERPRMWISTYPGITNSKIECKLKNFKLLTNSLSPTISPTISPTPLSTISPTPIISPTQIISPLSTISPIISPTPTLMGSNPFLKDIIEITNQPSQKKNNNLNDMLFHTSNDSYDILVIIMFITTILFMCIIFIFTIIKIYVCYKLKNNNDIIKAEKEVVAVEMITPSAPPIEYNV